MLQFNIGLSRPLSIGNILGNAVFGLVFFPVFLEPGELAKVRPL
jgi:hypothetical protein